MSLSDLITSPPRNAFRGFKEGTSRVEDPFVGQCKEVLEDLGMCPPPHPKWIDDESALRKSPWNESLPQVDVFSTPVLKRTNSVMNPGFFEQPIKIDGKKIELDRNSSNSTPIDDSIITVAGDIIPPNSENRSEPVIEVDCGDVEKVKNKKWRWCRCLK